MATRCLITGKPKLFLKQNYVLKLFVYFYCFTLLFYNSKTKRKTTIKVMISGQKYCIGRGTKEKTQTDGTEQRTEPWSSLVEGDAQLDRPNDQTSM